VLCRALVVHRFRRIRLYGDHQELCRAARALQRLGTVVSTVAAQLLNFYKYFEVM